MEYEIVNLEEKKAVGISAVTNNKSLYRFNVCGGEQHKSELRSDYNTKWKIC